MESGCPTNLSKPSTPKERAPHLGKTVVPLGVWNPLDSGPVSPEAGPSERPTIRLERGRHPTLVQHSFQPDFAPWGWTHSAFRKWILSSRRRNWTIQVKEGPSAASSPYPVLPFPSAQELHPRTPLSQAPGTTNALPRGKRMASGDPCTYLALSLHSWNHTALCISGRT